MQLNKAFWGMVVAGGFVAGCSSVDTGAENTDSSSAAQKAAVQQEDKCVTCKDPIANLEAELAQMQAELGISKEDMDRFRPVVVAALTQVRDQIAAMGTTPEQMNGASENSPFYDYLMARRSSENSDYTVVQVGTMKLLYRYHRPSTISSGDPNVPGEFVPGHFSLLGVFPETMSDSAILNLDQGKRDLFNQQLLEVALKVGPWLLVPVIGQASAACAIAAAGTLLVIDAATGETVGTITDDASFTVLAAGKLAPGPLKLAAHAWLIARLGVACVSVGKNAKLYMALLFANARAQGLTEEMFAGPSDVPVGPGSAAVCDVRPSKPQNQATCRDDNAGWARQCCPSGQRGTGACTLEAQRCVIDPAAPRPMPAPNAAPVPVKAIAVPMQAVAR